MPDESAHQSECFMQATIDALSANICVLDEYGTILSVNKGWRDFAAANSPAPQNIGIGTNYLDVCDAAMGDDREQARQFSCGIRSVLGGKSDFYSQEYACHSESEQRWFRGKVTRFTGTDLVRIVIAHVNITERKQSDEILSNIREELECQVQERTISLTNANQQLKQEIEERRRIEQEILDHQQKLQAMTSELVLARVRERDRIAGELHDQVGQRLILGKMRLDSLIRRLPSGQLENDAEDIIALIDQSIHDIRSLTFQLRPPILASAGLEAAVQWLGEELKEDLGLQMEFSDDNKPKALRYEVRSTVFQAVRELLLNVSKHAGTKNVKVCMQQEDGYLVININDDGIGFDTSEVSKRKAREGGYGLFSIKQKVDYLGGGLFIDTAPGKGTQATIMVPLDETN
jgi:signal transduction histidine kinase